MLSYMHTSINELNVAKRENDFNCQLSVGWSFQWFLHIFIRSCVHHCIVYLGRFFFLRFMTFDFGWVCLRKSENIMSDACCLVLLFFLLFHRFGSCECVWCWQAFCYFVNFQFAEMIFLLIFFSVPFMTIVYLSATFRISKHYHTANTEHVINKMEEVLFSLVWVHHVQIMFDVILSICWALKSICVNWKFYQDQRCCCSILLKCFHRIVHCWWSKN